MTTYPIIANSNYESGDENAQTIHTARKALDNGLTYDADLEASMMTLEETLTRELDAEGQHVNGQDSWNAIDKAESAVLTAFTVIE